MLSEEVGAFEAKTHFSQILEKVEQGADFTITKRGKPIAKIIPFEQEKKMTYHEAIEAFSEMRKNFLGDPKTFNIREAIEEGRQ